MSARNKFDRVSILAGVGAMVLVVAACAIKLRGDEDQISSASPESADADPLALELAKCRTVTSEQKDALEECRRIWAEQRRQFLGQKKKSLIALPSDSVPKVGLPASAPRKDESRLPQGWPSIPASEGE